MRRRIRFESTKVRGSPIYIRSGGRTISLVPEVSVQEGRTGTGYLRVLRPATLYVIDDKGVHTLPLRHGSGLRSVLVLALVLMLTLAPAVVLRPTLIPAQLWSRIRRSEHSES